MSRKRFVSVVLTFVAIGVMLLAGLPTAAGVSLGSTDPSGVSLGSTGPSGVPSVPSAVPMASVTPSVSYPFLAFAEGLGTVNLTVTAGDVVIVGEFNGNVLNSKKWTATDSLGNTFKYVTEGAGPNTAFFNSTITVSGADQITLETGGSGNGGWAIEVPSKMGTVLATSSSNTTCAAAGGVSPGVSDVQMPCAAPALSVPSIGISTSFSSGGNPCDTVGAPEWILSCEETTGTTRYSVMGESVNVSAGHQGYFYTNNTGTTVGESPSWIEIPTEQTSTPTGLKVTSTTPASVSLSWANPTAVGTVVNDTVEQSRSGTGPWTGYSTSGAVTAFTQPVSSGGTWYFEVRAWNSTAETGPSNVVSATIPLGYNNATFVLPSFACWGQYQTKPGGANDCQTPLLAWTQDGVYYVNASSYLVFYSFTNKTAYSLGPWTLLWQNVANYNMIPNLLFLTQDGSYVYTWGTLVKGSSTLTVEATNVTTHRRFIYNFTTVTTSSVTSNGQVQMTGFNGNDSFLTLITAAGAVVSHNIWTSTEKTVANLTYFEANNVYWIPYLNAYFNVEADGSSGDGVEEWQMSSNNGSLTRVFSGTWGSGVVVNGVSGWAFNVTSRQLMTVAENYMVTYDVNGAGVITTLVSSLPTVAAGSTAFPSLGATSASDRGTLSSGNSPFYNVIGAASNESFLFYPGHSSPAGTYVYPTNASPFIYNNGTLKAYTSEQYYQDNTFYNTSFFVADSSVACPRGALSFLSACSVNTTAVYPEGTIWYRWLSSGPEFPFPASAPLAQTEYPSTTTTAAESLSSTSVKLSWSVPTEASYPIINYSLAWSENGGPTTYVSISPQALSYTLTGLTSGDMLSYVVKAWNLHWVGPASTREWLVGSTPPGSPSFTNIASTSVTVNWTQAVFPGSSAVVNDTVLVGTACGTWTLRVSTGGAAIVDSLSGLTAATTYCVSIEAWNSTAATLTGPTASFTTLGPITPPSLVITSVSFDSFTETWSNGTWTNNTQVLLVITNGLSACKNTAGTYSYWTWGVLHAGSGFIPSTGTVSYEFNYTLGFVLGYNSSFLPGETVWVGLLTNQSGTTHAVFSCQSVTFGLTVVIPVPPAPWFIITVGVILALSMVYFAIYWARRKVHWDGWTK